MTLSEATNKAIKLSKRMSQTMVIIDQRWTNAGFKTVAQQALHYFPNSPKVASYTNGKLDQSYIV